MSRALASVGVTLGARIQGGGLARHQLDLGCVAFRSGAERRVWPRCIERGFAPPSKTNESVTMAKVWWMSGCTLPKLEKTMKSCIVDPILVRRPGH